MYKDASNKQTYINRVASHATKEHASGRIDAVPTGAQQPVDYFNSLAEQYRNLNENYHVLTIESVALRAKLKQTMPYDEFRRIDAQSNTVGQMIHQVQQSLAELRPFIREAREDAEGAYRWHLAKDFLKAPDIEYIEKQAAEFKGRVLPVSDTLRKKSTGEKEGVSHANQARMNKENLHRRKSRQYREKAKAEGLTMYDGSRYSQSDKPLQRRLTVSVDVMKKKLADHFNNKR